MVVVMVAVRAGVIAIVVVVVVLWVGCVVLLHTSQTERVDIKDKVTTQVPAR
jgi:hypothetical protein